MTEYEAMRHNWMKAVEQNAKVRQHCELLEDDVRRLTIALGKHECAKCGADRSDSRVIHEVSSDPVCAECGEYWA